MTLRHEMTLNRDNGDVVRLIAIKGCDPIGHLSSDGFCYSSINMFAAVTFDGQETEEYFHPEQGPKSMNGMSVDEYVKHGRVGLISVVRPHEIIKISLALEAKCQSGAMAS